jgi:hypothetical protein
LGLFLLPHYQILPQWFFFVENCASHPSVKQTVGSLVILEMNSLPGHGGAAGSSNESWCTPSASICDMDPNAWEWVGGPGISTVSEWGLICGHEYKIGLAQSAFFIGGLLGNILCFPLSFRESTSV